MRSRRHAVSNGRVIAAAVCGLALLAGGTPAMASRGGQAAKPPGTQLWASRFTGPGRTDNQASAVALSPGGATVFVTGIFGLDATTSPAENYGTVGYNAATGKQVWASHYDGAGGDDSATATAVSPDGRTVFVTGESQGPLQGNGHAYDYATVAYDAATGKQLWASRYDGHGSMDHDDFARAIAVSHDGGTVYVTGQGSGKTSVWDYTTVAYDAATGKQMWDTSYNGSDNNADAANALAVSPDDRRVFVTGVVRTRKPAGTDYGTIAYDARTGARRWVSLYAGPERNSTANAVRVSPDGLTVFVTGKSAGQSTGYDFATVAYSASTGATRWVSRLASQRDDIANAIAVSPRGGSVYVTGQSYTTPLNRRPEFLTATYNARTGAAGWVRLFQAPGQCRNIPTAVAVGARGRTVFVSGYSADTNPAGRQPCASGLTTIAYRGATGAQAWRRRVRGADAFGAGLVVSRKTNTVIVTGGVFPNAGHGEDYTTIAYRG